MTHPQLPLGCEIVSAPFQVFFVRITPEGAAALIEKNKIANRHSSYSRIDAIKSDLITGEWKTNHQGIAFDKDYNNIDGKHRLIAIRDSGVPAIVMVSVGVPLDVLSTIDNTRPRSVSDHVIQMVETNSDYCGITTSYAAIASILEYGYGSLNHLSMAQKLTLIVKYKDAIEFAVKATRGCTGLQVTAKAVIARAWYTQDHDAIQRFCDVYRTELPDGKEEWAATALKKHLTSTNTTGQGMRKMVYQKTESALSAFLKRISLSKIYASEIELFPLPTIF